VSGKIDPLHDIEVISTELNLADLESVDRALHKAQKQAKTARKEDLRWHDLLMELCAHLDRGQPARTFEVPAAECGNFQELFLLTRKPVMYVANVDENGLTGNAHVDAVRARAVAEGAEVVVICAGIEAEIARLDQDDKDVFLNDLGLEEPGLNRVIRAGYGLLGLQTFFTAGPKEVRAWTCPAGATAPEAAGEIHTDFQRGFIRAEVISFADYVAGGGEQGARDAGRLRLEGKEYIIQEGDVVHFRFNV